jgi:16S rRNA (adenine1518-N6/adenine1519-N6)-dimethyltransferase
VVTGLLGPAQIRELAARLGVAPTKRLGQNFVHDANTVRRIVESARLSAEDTVLEVGPGLGSLTLGLLPACAQVTAVEIDPVLAGRLPQTVREHAPEYAGRLTVIQQDALRLTGDQLDATALVANLPYNVAVPVVLHLLGELPSIRHGLVMVQAEVADRMAAPPGSRVYGIPSVKAAWYAEVRKAGTVSRTVFWPVPNVDSALIQFTRREPPGNAEKDAVFDLVDAAFAQRRKMLRQALAGWAGSSQRAGELITSAGIDPTTRGEQLTVGQFAKIAERAGRKGSLT